MTAFSIEGVSVNFNVVRFTGAEELALPYQFAIEVTSNTPDLDIAAMLGKHALLTLDQNGTMIYRHGMLEQVSIGDKQGGLTSYHFTLVPDMLQLVYRKQFRIYQQKSVDDIIEEILNVDNIGDYEILFERNHPPREYTVQFGESDLDFLHRLLAEEGIYYYFTHAANSHTVIFADDTAEYAAIENDKNLTFDANGSHGAGDVITAFELETGLVGNAVSMRDYNPARPAANLEVTRKVTSTVSYQQDNYPGRYREVSLGQQRAQARLDAFQVEAEQGHAESDCMRIMPGHVFALKRHTRSTLNKDYVVLRVMHEGDLDASGQQTYRNRFSCLRANRMFVPEYGLQLRRMAGPQTATVTGPAGEEIFVDETGRVKVQFHWDRQGQSDENSSAWLRVSQVMAGKGWGSLFIPRIGSEVVVGFLNGDPDAPFVMGQMYNGNNMPPYQLPANRTTSGFKTQSSKGGGGGHELRFNDTKGSEQLFIKSERDLLQQANNDVATVVGHDYQLQVGSHAQITVARNGVLTIGANASCDVGANATLNIGSNQVQNVGGSQSQAIGSNQSETIGRHGQRNVGGNQSVAVGGNHTQTTGKTFRVLADKIELVANSGFTLKVGSAKIVISKSGRISVTSGDSIDIKSSKTVTIKGRNIRQNEG